MRELFLTPESNPLIEIDCFQNLIMLMLASYGLETRFLGTIWPWGFRLRRNSMRENGEVRWVEVENIDPVDETRLQQLFGATLTRTKFASAGGVLENVCYFTDRGIPVFVGLDQYYVPYHYPHIYHKQHGLHTTLVTGVNLKEGWVNCLSAIPQYQGAIRLSEFFNGIEHCVTIPWSAILSLEDAMNSTESGVWDYFVNEVSMIQKERMLTGVCRNRHFTADILKLLQEVISLDSEAEMAKKIQCLCEGVWGWQIERKGKFLSEYLKMPYVQNRFLEWQTCLALIEEANQNWAIAFRLLFKGIHLHTRKSLDKVMVRLESNLPIEEHILELVLVQT